MELVALSNPPTFWYDALRAARRFYRNSKGGKARKRLYVEPAVAVILEECAWPLSPAELRAALSQGPEFEQAVLAVAALYPKVRDENEHVHSWRTGSGSVLAFVRSHVSAASPGRAPGVSEPERGPDAVSGSFPA